ncbi:hypothetical protein BABINDRAFT_162128 [Babjeviella inositovora NRRL Y-12698]|uniref:DNA recombination and repair protein Rad51-like C-terminal domain-containing protein n=1 Tax=Babjeviella inositovora NRRL Y-12698 TaxID=984486 RepID=A0A1E3QQ13_9ASCO|nr:uncharacterized protein BABINDRAFT_162128 [Babjeviella inositovora NRRL Y-12698]ODQ79057.1 hypothetical protein BABINDRAFT_162128 [Babjeviella inositovora NRRL Y-12698]
MIETQSLSSLIQNLVYPLSFIPSFTLPLRGGLKTQSIYEILGVPGNGWPIVTRNIIREFVAVGKRVLVIETNKECGIKHTQEFASVSTVRANKLSKLVMLLQKLTSLTDTFDLIVIDAFHDLVEATKNAQFLLYQDMLKDVEMAKLELAKHNEARIAQGGETIKNPNLFLTKVENPVNKFNQTTVLELLNIISKLCFDKNLTCLLTGNLIAVSEKLTIIGEPSGRGDSPDGETATLQGSQRSGFQYVTRQFLKPLVSSPWWFQYLTNRFVVYSDWSIVDTKREAVLQVDLYGKDSVPSQNSQSRSPKELTPSFLGGNSSLLLQSYGNSLPRPNSKSGPAVAKKLSSIGLLIRRDKTRDTFLTEIGSAIKTPNEYTPLEEIITALNGGDAFEELLQTLTQLEVIFGDPEVLPEISSLQTTALLPSTAEELEISHPNEESYPNFSPSTPTEMVNTPILGQELVEVTYTNVKQTENVNHTSFSGQKRSQGRRPTGTRSEIDEILKRQKFGVHSDYAIQESNREALPIYPLQATLHTANVVDKPSYLVGVMAADPDISTDVAGSKSSSPLLDISSIDLEDEIEETKRLMEEKGTEKEGAKTASAAKTTLSRIPENDLPVKLATNAGEVCMGSVHSQDNVGAPGQNISNTDAYAESAYIDACHDMAVTAAEREKTCRELSGSSPVAVNVEDDLYINGEETTAINAMPFEILAIQGQAREKTPECLEEKDTTDLGLLQVGVIPDSQPASWFGEYDFCRGSDDENDESELLFTQLLKEGKKL